MDAILLASSGCFLPSALDMALAPPTPKRLEMAVSITKDGYTMVIAAVWSGSFSIPTKYVSARL